jgi:hypothetical protein
MSPCRDCVPGVVYGQDFVMRVLGACIKPGRTPEYPYDFFVGRKRRSRVSTHDW